MFHLVSPFCEISLDGALVVVLVGFCLFVCLFVCLVFVVWFSCCGFGLLCFSSDFSSFN